MWDINYTNKTFCWQSILYYWSTSVITSITQILFFSFLQDYYEEMYMNQLNLAYCFNKPKDKWLRNYFYEQCYKTAQLIKIDGGRKEAEAHANMGLVREEQGR